MFHVKLTGDASHGWIAEVFDGIHNETYWPAGSHPSEAMSNTISSHMARFFEPPAMTPSASPAAASIPADAPVDAPVDEPQAAA
jgi:hypothetical protein